MLFRSNTNNIVHSTVNDRYIGNTLNPAYVHIFFEENKFLHIDNISIIGKINDDIIEKVSSDFNLDVRNPGKVTIKVLLYDEFKLYGENTNWTTIGTFDNLAYDTVTKIANIDLGDTYKVIGIEIAAHEILVGNILPNGYDHRLVWGGINFGLSRGDDDSVYEVRQWDTKIGRAHV